MKRYEWSFRTRSRGHEDQGADYCYDSLLSGGPVGALDKIVRRVRVKDLPLGPAFDDSCSWGPLEEKSGEGYGAFELKRELTPELFHIRRGKSGAVFGSDWLLYLELVDVPWRGSPMKPFADALVALADNEVLDLGPRRGRRSRAYDLLRTVLRISEIEFRIDLPFRESLDVAALLADYRDDEGHFRVCSYEKRYESRYYLKPYGRSLGRFAYLRVEMVFYYRDDEPAFELPLGIEAALKELWPSYVKNVERLRRYGKKPELAAVLETIRGWSSIRRRARELYIWPEVVDAMVEKNRKATGSDRVF